eukprot:15461567-Alexandrium_andersonii.AAC.1
MRPKCMRHKRKPACGVPWPKHHAGFAHAHVETRMDTDSHQKHDCTPLLIAETPNTARPKLQRLERA